MNVEWNEVLEEWQTTIGTVLITSPSKADVERLLDRLDEQQQRAKDNTGLCGAILLGAFLFALAAVLSAALAGC